MTAVHETHTALQALLDRFFAAWARHDLDAAMACMAEDSRYDEFNGVLWEGVVTPMRGETRVERGIRPGPRRGR